MCRKLSTEEFVGMVGYAEEAYKTVIMGYIKSLNATLASSLNDSVTFTTNNVLIQNVAASKSEINAALFKWDETNNTLDISRAYYDTAVKYGDITVTINDDPVVTESALETKLTGKVTANGTVTAIIAMTQAEYDALTSPDPTTLYIITD